MLRADKYSQTQLNHLASLAKWLSVHLRTEWLWVRIPLLSLKTSESLNNSDGEIKFCQWTTTDRANVINRVETIHRKCY